MKYVEKNRDELSKLITTVIFAKDCVPRAQWHTIAKLRVQIVKLLSICQVPTAKILRKSTQANEDTIKHLLPKDCPYIINSTNNGIQSKDIEMKDSDKAPILNENSSTKQSQVLINLDNNNNNNNYSGSGDNIYNDDINRLLNEMENKVVSNDENKELLWNIKYEHVNVYHIIKQNNCDKYRKRTGICQCFTSFCCNLCRCHPCLPDYKNNLKYNVYKCKSILNDNNIIVSLRSWPDHMPNVYLHALNTLDFNSIKIASNLNE